MRVLYVLNKLSHTSIPLEMAKQMSKVFETTVISLYDSEHSAREIINEVAPNCKYVVCDMRKNLLNGLIKFNHIISVGEFDIIHTHQSLSGSLARWVARKKNKTKVIHTVHANHNSFTMGQNLIIGLTLKYCDVIVGNSKTTLDGLKSWQKKLIRNVPKVVIYNGIDCDAIQNAPTDKGDKLIKKYNISSDEFVFGLVGRFVKVKNHQNVLKAFGNFLQNAPIDKKYRLLLVGDGPEKEKLEEIIQASTLLKEHVVVTGLLPRETVYSLLHRFNVFIMASFYEGFCNALMEALVSGVPAMVSRISVFSELFDDNNMMMFDPNNLQEMEKCIGEIISIEQSFEDRNETMKKLRLKYDISVSFECYAALYRKIYK